MGRHRKMILKLLAAAVLWFALWLQFSHRGELYGGIETSDYFSLLLAAMMVAPVIVLLFFYGYKRRSLQMADWLVLGFMGYIVFHALTTHSTEGRELYFTCGYFVLYLCFRMMAEARATQYGLLVVLLAGLYEAMMVLLQLWGSEPSNHHRFMVTGSFYNPGPCGIFLSAVLVLAASIVKKGGFRLVFNFWSVRYLAAYVTLIACLVAIIPTMSRAGWMGAVVGLMLLYRKEIREAVTNVRYKAIVWVGVAGVVVILSGVYLMKKDSADGRLFMWRNGIAACGEAPLFGSGIDCFGERYGQAQYDYFLEKEALTTEAENSAVAGVPVSLFNEFISLAMRLGLVGILFIAAIFRVKFSRWTIWSYTAIALLVSSFFSYPFYIPLITIVFLFAMAHLPQGRESGAGFRWVIPLCAVAAAVVCGVAYRSINAYKEWKNYTLFYSMKDYESVCEEYGKLSLGLKSDCRFLFEYGHSLNKTGRFDESNKVLTAGAKRSCDPMFWNIIGNNYLESGDYVNSEQAYLKAFYLCPNRHYSLYLLTKLHVRTGDAEKQEFYGRLLLRKKPKVKSAVIEEMMQETEEILKNN